jgi:dTDP-4-amino-4,6-dideoxygalactose transaminase
MTPNPDRKVPYTNFPLLIKDLRADLHKSLDVVLDSGRYILGPHMIALEKAIAERVGTKYALGVSSGTCALHLTLRQLGIGAGDEVITAPNSFLASASSVAIAGAIPRFADVGDDMNMDPGALEAAITPRTRAVIPVHLTGRPAQMPRIMEIARRHNLLVLEDCAQAIGAKLDGKAVGSWGAAGAFSCHPLKNLFAYGDSGLITTSDTELNRKLWLARSHGMPDRDTCDFWSHNCRMDEVQAAFLLVNLSRLDAWTNERRRLAFRYNELLSDFVRVPIEGNGEYHVYQTYMIRTDRRDELQEFLRTRSIEALTHYRKPIHMQPAASGLGYGPDDFPVAKKLSETILSLPLYPGLTEGQQDYVRQCIAEFFGR